MNEHPELEELRTGIQRIDREMAALFEQRMHIAEGIIRNKMEKGLPVLDAEREAKLLQTNLAHITDPVLKEYYVLFQKHLMDLSKSYQSRLREEADAAPTKGSE